MSKRRGSELQREGPTTERARTDRGKSEERAGADARQQADVS